MTRTPGDSPWRARVWREAGSSGAYVDMDPDVRPDNGTSRPQAEPYPAGASATAVLAWVGTDSDRAWQAHAAERLRPQPRLAVMGPLQRMLGSTEKPR